MEPGVRAEYSVTVTEIAVPRLVAEHPFASVTAVRV